METEIEVSVGDKVTLTSHIITKTDWASLGVDEDTEFTVVSVNDIADTSVSPKATLRDGSGEEFPGVPVGELIFL